MSRILIVDDDEAVRNLLRSFAQKQGHQVISAGTAEECFEKMAEKPELVLLDILLPDLHGLQVLNRIREMAPDVPVIMVTGLADNAIGLESLNRGAVDFVTKPIDLNHLEFLMDFHILRTNPEGSP